MFSVLLSLIKYFFTISLFLICLIIVILTVLKIYGLFTIGKCKSKVRLDGKVVLITGGNSGIGLETARDLARRGAKVIIASRDVVKSEKVVADIIAETGNGNVEQRYLDLAKFSSVRTFAEEFNKAYDRLDILINNSGTGGLKHKLTDDGIDLVTQINYFGPFLLTNLLLDKVINSKPSRIVIVSSKVHLYGKLDLEDLQCEKPAPWYNIYATTKLLNVMWAKALAKRVPDGVTVNVLHPGIVQTEIFNKFGPKTNKLVLTVIGSFFKNPEEGAQTTIHLAVSEEVSNISGKYFTDCQISDEAPDAKNIDLINKVWENSLLITKS